MCGIAGVLSLGPSGDATVIERMTARLAHRGPDDSGLLIDGGIALGHRRLAVIDTSSGGHQPMRRGDHVVVFNGELYNFRALRLELAALGHRFDSESDTEVLLAGALAWGVPGLLERADGMFAFALVDLTRRVAYLARDRMGEKPLYTAELPGGTLVFGSELSAVRAHPDVSAALDPVGVRRLFTLDAIPAPRTVLRDVRKLEPGELLCWDRGAIRRQRWRPTLNRAPVEEPRRALWDAIVSSVGDRLVSDVPLGVFVSGGLDSTAVLAAAAEHRSGLDTFCVGFDDASFDESAHARAVAAHFGARHHEERLTAQAALDLVPTLGALLDEPHADPSLLPTTLLARFARRHVTVALSGDGGDELFLGYPTFGAHAVARLAERAPAALRSGLLRPLIHALPVSHDNWSLDYQLKRFVDGLDYGPFERHLVWIGNTDPRLHPTLFEPAFMAAANKAPPFDDVTNALAGTEHLDDLTRLGELYARLYLSDGVLQKVDRATMSVALESRAPLLGRAVVEVAARIPASEKLKGLPPRQVTKAILREVLESRAPASIVKRPKKGFGVPIGRWLQGPLLPLLRELLDAATLRRQAVFKAETCEKLISEHLSGYRDHRKTLWALLVFQLWAREHLPRP